MSRQTAARHKRLVLCTRAVEEAPLGQDATWWPALAPLTREERVAVKQTVREIREKVVAP